LKLRIILASLWAAVLAIGGLALGAAPASASIVNSSGYHHLQNVRSGGCLDITAEWRCLNTFNEEWSTPLWRNFEGTGMTAIQLVEHGNGMCLAASSTLRIPGAVVQVPCASEPTLDNRNQFWVIDSPGGSFRLLDGQFLGSDGSFQCLDLDNGNPANGTLIQTYDCFPNDYGNNNQQWNWL
jgi:hypothetical protein